MWGGSSIENPRSAYSFKYSRIMSEDLNPSTIGIQTSIIINWQVELVCSNLRFTMSKASWPSVAKWESIQYCYKRLTTAIELKKLSSTMRTLTRLQSLMRSSGITSRLFVSFLPSSSGNLGDIVYYRFITVMLLSVTEVFKLSFAQQCSLVSRI